MDGKVVHIGGKAYAVNLQCELTESRMILCSRVKPRECHECEHYVASMAAPDFYNIINNRVKGD